MSKPKLQSKTPDSSDVNTLLLNHDDILENPEKRRYAIIEYAVTDVLHPIGGTGDDTARLRIVHFEDMDGHLKDQVTKLLDEAFTNRTGQRMRPAPGSPDTPLDLSAIGGITVDPDAA
jgi:hypothetical protein